MVTSPTLALFPTWTIVFFVFVLGAIIGSFLDVVVTRFHTGASINGRSRCMSCGKDLCWYELVPCLSYLLLRGRCHGCNSLIPKRLLITEVLTGGLFLLVFFSSTSLSALFLNWVLVSVLVVVTIYDLEHMIIPNEFVATLLVVAAALWYVGVGESGLVAGLLPVLISVGGAFFFYASLWFVSRGRWIGFGDAKLAAPLAIVLPPMATMSFVILSFWVGAAISLTLILVQYLLKRGQKHLPFLIAPITMKSEVPFAPFMIAAFLLVYFLQVDVLNLVSFISYALL